MNSISKSVSSALFTGILLFASSAAYAASCSKGVCTVQPNDSLDKIVKQLKKDFNITVSIDQLVNLNNIRDRNVIHPGKQIKYR